jgi:AbrB family looped-hinge helix DNA binding protein
MATKTEGRKGPAKPPVPEKVLARPVKRAEASKVGKRGMFVIPAWLRRRFGIEEGSMVIVEEQEGGILIRPAAVVPMESYTPERKAQFILSNAMDKADYAMAVRRVLTMGLDPDTIPHYKPPGV